VRVKQREVEERQDLNEMHGRCTESPMRLRLTDGDSRQSTGKNGRP